MPRWGLSLNYLRDRAVATAIMGLARALDISVVADGVETETQASFSPA